jgi:hypothetical protein
METMKDSSAFTVNARFLYKVLVEPTRTFRHLKHSPSILSPFLLIAVSCLLVTATVYPHLLELIGKIIEIETSVFVTMLVGTALFILICGAFIVEWAILSTLIYFGIVILSEELPSFKVVFSCVGYSWVPVIIKTLAFAVLIFFFGRLFESKGFTVLFPDIQNKVLYGFLQQIDIFFIWHFVILFFCIKVLVPDTHWIKPLVIVGAPYTLLFSLGLILFLL